jgi:hypothetical protein
MDTARIRELNDALRTTFTGGRVMLTASVNNLPDRIRALAITKVKTFDEFTNENDPRGEHDFGIFAIDGQTFYFKIDYYDDRCEFGSEDPSDPQKTTRVLTIMLAEDY